jgi:hypothetical protein
LPLPKRKRLNEKLSTAAWNSTLMADRYWSPSPNHANQWEFSIAEPQTLGFGSEAR